MFVSHLTVDTNKDLELVRVFRLTSSSTNVKNEGLITTSAEADYTAKGLIQTVQGTVIHSRARVQRTTQTIRVRLLVVLELLEYWIGLIQFVNHSWSIFTNGIFVSSIEVFFATKAVFTVTKLEQWQMVI